LSGIVVFLEQTRTILVAGNDSPGYSSSRPTNSATWPGVIMPDQRTAQQATQPGGPYAMPSYNPTTTPVNQLLPLQTEDAPLSGEPFSAEHPGRFRLELGGGDALL